MSNAAGCSVSPATGWFKEGLAVHLSGSGAETVSEAEARDAIGRHQLFKPINTGSLLFPQTGSGEGLKVHLFYRESAMFVGYLARRDPAAFEQLLNALAERQPFAESFRRAYASDTATLQADFVAEIKNAGPSSAR